MGIKRIATFIGVIICFLSTGIAYAQAYNFYAITEIGSPNALVGEKQFSVDVTAASDGRVLFTFYNIGSTYCSIDAVYFQDGPFLGLAEIINSSDPMVQFQQYATPGNLPGGNELKPYAFEATVGFTADANNPPITKGINPGESLGIYFYLNDGVTFQNVIGGLNTFEPDDPFRIGIHALAFDTGPVSVSFVNTPVPVPATLLLLGSGLLGLAGFRKRMMK